MERAEILGRTESLHEAAQLVQPDIGTMIPVYERKDFLIDKRHDLIAVKVPDHDSAFAHTDFVDLETEAYTRDLAEGVSLIMLGAPIDSRVKVAGFGETIIMQVENVRYDPNLDISGLTNENYSPSNFYLPYSLTQDGIAPYGFSGAAVFVNKEPARDGVWCVTPHIVGVAQRYARHKDFLIARKISTAIDLLEADRNAD